MDNQFNNTLTLIDKYLSPVVRLRIEKAYYEKINQQARISEAIKDPAFLAHPLEHASLFTDHGLVHVRDITARLLTLLDDLNGIHFAKRNPVRLEFMKGYGAILAYVHDIGMIETHSALEQDMHAQYAAQAMYNDFFDEILATLWEENSGNVAWRITRMSIKKFLHEQPKQVLREMLALSCAHNRNLISTQQLNHPEDLRRTMQEINGYSLAYQAWQAQIQQAQRRLLAAEKVDAEHRERFVKEKLQLEQGLQKAMQENQVSDQLNPFLKLFYRDFRQEAFAWLSNEHAEVREFVEDVIDTIRVLRCANASRQRGAKLRASGGYQIFLDRQSGSALYAINAQHKLFLLRSNNPLLAGEVNLSSTEFTQAGDLRISFYWGSFADESTTERAAFNAAIAINEVQEDMIGAFARPPAGNDNSCPEYLKKWQPVYILLENCDDNSHFAERVAQQLALINPALKDTLRTVPSLQGTSEQERNRYLAAEDIQWNFKTQKELIEKIAETGHKIANMQPRQAFANVRSAQLRAGETLTEIGTSACFVYIPLGEGLVGYPTGGYQPFHARAFIPLGNVGVIRGDIRNATIIAEQAVKVLMIPKETYMRYWHNTYSETEFIKTLKEQLNTIKN